MLIGNNARLETIGNDQKKEEKMQSCIGSFYNIGKTNNRLEMVKFYSRNKKGNLKVLDYITLSSFTHVLRYSFSLFLILAIYINKVIRNSFYVIRSTK